MRSGARIAQLADILIDPHHPEALAPLLRATVDAARESGLGGIQAWLPRRHPYRTALIQQGFLETGLNAHCQYIANNAPPALDQVLTDPGAALHITSADTDWV